MKAKKPDKSVSKMAVLQDIRGLLSATQGEAPALAPLGYEDSLKAEIAQLQERVRSQTDLVRTQLEEIHRLERENEDLAAKLNTRCFDKDKLTSPAPGTDELREEITQLETRKAELSSVLYQIDGLFQLKVKELLKRIARLYQEAGQGDTAMEFRKAADELEVAENFAYFLRALLKQ